MNVDKTSFITLAALATSLAACTGEDVAGEGALRLTISGGVAVVEGYPHDETDLGRLEFVDGWAIQFERFLVAMGEVRLTEQLPDGERGDGPLVANWTGPGIVDLMSPVTGTDLPSIEGIPATRHDLGFDLVRATAGAQNISATEADAQRLIDNGWTVLLEGTATRTGTTVRFSVGFEAPTRFSRCANGLDGTRGIAVEASKTTGAFMYPHTPHLWWDELIGTNSGLRFDAWAAVAGEDGVVTADELAQQNLLDLRAADGGPLLDPETGRQVRYDDGGLLPASQLDLLSYVIYGFRQSAHFNGLGFCPWEPL